MRTTFPWPFGDSSAHFDEDDNYVVVADAEVDGGLIRWELVQASDGALRSLAAHVPASASESVARSVVDAAIRSAFAETTQTFVQRRVYAYIGPALASPSYWLSPDLCVSRVLDDDEGSLYLINAERLVALDMRVEAVDASHAGHLANLRAHRISALLSLALGVGLYTIPHAQVWVLHRTDGDSESLRLNRGAHLPGPPADFPKKSKDYQPALSESWPIYGFMGGELIALPRKWRSLLRAIEADTAIGNAVDSAARLVQLSRVARVHSRTMALAYMVAAIESIPKRLGTGASFSDFAREHSPAGEVSDHYLDALYGRFRSGHFHAGSDPLSRPQRPADISDREAAELNELGFSGMMFLTGVLRNWLDRVVAEQSN